MKKLILLLSLFLPTFLLAQGVNIGQGGGVFIGSNVNLASPEPIGSTGPSNGTFSILNGVLNPASCGASSPPSWCSGGDLGAWVNSALTACSSAPCTVYVPSGNYSITTAITLGTKQNLKLLPGTYTLSAKITVGQQASVFCDATTGEVPNTGYGECVVKQANGANLNPMFALNGTNAVLEGVVVDGNNANNSSAGPNILITGLRDRIIHVNSIYSNSHGLDLGDGTLNPAAAAQVMDSMFLWNTGSGIYGRRTADVFIRTSEFENNSRYGIEGLDFEAFRIINSDFGGNNLGGISCIGTVAGTTGCGGWMITNSQFGGNLGHDIFYQNYDATGGNYSGVLGWVVVGNTFAGLNNSAIDNSYDAIHFKDTLRDVIAGNVIFSTPSHRYRYGIAMEETALGRSLAVTIAGNNVDGSIGTGGLLTLSKTNFTGNTIFGSTTMQSSPLAVPSIKATTGTRYVCVDTNGNLVSSATACSGT